MVGHRAVFDRDDRRHGLVSEQEPTGVDRKVPRKIEQFRGEADQMLVRRMLRVESCRGKRRRVDVAAHRTNLRHAVEHRLRHAENLSHLTYRRAYAVADDVRDHGRVSLTRYTSRIPPAPRGPTIS